MFHSALGGSKAEDEYNEANKRHTMSSAPEHIPDIDTSPSRVKSQKDKKEKDKVRKFIFCMNLIRLIFSLKGLIYIIT